MAKLDDFGRPIYETAEEYNKAHRGGVCPRPYDNPEGANYGHNTGDRMKQFKNVAQRHILQEGSQKSKAILGGVIGVFAVIYLIIIGVVMINTVGGVYEETPVVGTEIMQDSYSEFLGDGETPLPEGFEKFKYNGYPCTLPTDFEEIMIMGCEITDYDMYNEVFYADYEELLDIYDKRTGIYLGDIRIKNDTSESLVIKECSVDRFFIYNAELYDPTVKMPNFMFGDGLTFNSTYEEVEAYFGTPYWYCIDYSDKAYKHEIYQWSYFEEADEESDIWGESHFVEITFLNGRMEYVIIEKQIVERKY